MGLLLDPDTCRQMDARLAFGGADGAAKGEGRSDLVAKRSDPRQLLSPRVQGVTVVHLAGPHTSDVEYIEF